MERIAVVAWSGEGKRWDHTHWKDKALTTIVLALDLVLSGIPDRTRSYTYS